MASRTDEHGRAYKKSQLQMQLWANRRRAALTTAVLDALPTLAALNPHLTWVSPVEGERFAEYHDSDFLFAIERFDLLDELAAYWPSGGPHWDALAVARSLDGRYLGPVLVEAKSYPAEMRSRLAASDPDSRRRILERLADTRTWLGVPEQHAEAWTDRYYQLANRLAHLRWFRDVLGETAWLANIYFLADPGHPMTRAQWETALDNAEHEMGLTGVSLPDHGRVFVRAGTRDELLPPATDPADAPPFRRSPFLVRGNYAWPHVLEPTAWSHYFREGDTDDEGSVLRVEWSPDDAWQVWLLRHVPGSPPRWGAQWEHDRLLRRAGTLAGLAEQELPAEATALYPTLRELVELASSRGVERLLWDWSPGNLGMDTSLRVIAVMGDGEAHDLATTLTMVPDDEGVLVVTERSVEETLPEAVERLRQLVH